jgi:hypothetical protein
MDTRLFTRVALCAALGYATSQSAGTLHAQARTPRSYTGTLVAPRVTGDADGRIVISMEAKGDLRGMITFELEPDGASGALKGKWALVVAYAQDLNADGSIAAIVDPHEEEPGHNDPEHHREYVRFVREGTVFGDITSATLRAADGGIAGIDVAQLLVSSGSMTFASATGAGLVTISPADATVTSITLNF